MSIQAIRLNMSSNSSSSIANRFAALAVDDEAPASAAPTRTSPPIQQSQQSQQAPRRAYVPPNMRHNNAPVTQSRLRAPPNVSSTSDFPSLGARHTPVTGANPSTAGAGGWASRARSWAEYDETSAAMEQQRKHREQYEASMITLSRPAFRTHRPPTFAPGTSEFVPPHRYIPSSAVEDDENNIIDPAEAYIGGYDHARYAACDYEEQAEDHYAPHDNEGSHTPPYPPYPY